MSTTPAQEPPYSSRNMEAFIQVIKNKKIPLYEPGEDDYERYVATSNLIYRFSRPPCVVQPKCACDVRDVIKTANPKKIPITVKNGGHSYAGGSTTNIGILMELGLMNQVDIDLTVGNETATVKGGALWFQVYKKLISIRLYGKQLDGWVVNGGRCPTVGVSGFMLGGGLSPFTRSFGMGCDTVKEFTIVTAKGDEVTVSEDNGGDTAKDELFWALRGAGGGNFGVVVEMKLALQKLRTNSVVAGRYTWYPENDPWDGIDAFLGTMRSFYTKNWSNQMTIDSSWLCDLSDTKNIGVRFLVYYNGEQAAFDQEIDNWTLENPPSEDRVRTKVEGNLKELRKQFKRRSLEEPSSRFLHETLAAQWVEETKKSLPTTRVYQIYTSFVFRNEPQKIQKITEVIGKEMQRFRKDFAGEKGLMQVSFIHSGGEANSKSRDDTAFPWRGSTYNTYIMLEWSEKWLEKSMRSFLGELKPKLSDYGMVKWATFINFPDDTLKPEAHEKAYFGDNRHKLREIKQLWDPDNFFNWPQGIRLPAQESDEEGRREALINEALTDQVALQQWKSYQPPASTKFYGGGALPALCQDSWGY